MARGNRLAMCHVIALKGFNFADEIKQFMLYLVSRSRWRELPNYLLWASSLEWYESCKREVTPCEMKNVKTHLKETNDHNAKTY